MPDEIYNTFVILFYAKLELGFPDIYSALKILELEGLVINSIVTYIAQWINKNKRADKLKGTL